jgi:hypothetical protein
VSPVVIPNSDPRTNPSADDLYYFFDRDDRIKFEITKSGGNLSYYSAFIEQSTGNAGGTSSSLSLDEKTAYIKDYSRAGSQWGIIDGHNPGAYNQFVWGSPGCNYVQGNQIQCNNNIGQFTPRIFLRLKTLSIQNRAISGANSTDTFIINEAIPPNGTNAYGARTGTFLQAYGGMPPYQFTIISGQLPPGVSINSQNGEIGGTPTELGTFNSTIKLTDSHATSAFGSEATVDLSLHIVEQSPITVNEGPHIFYLRSSYRNQGLQLPTLLNPQGGIEPYSYSSRDSLNFLGLNLLYSRIIYGDPQVNGRGEEMITITDYSGQSIQVPIMVSTYDRNTVNFLSYKRLQDSSADMKYYLLKDKDYSIDPYKIPVGGAENYYTPVAEGFEVRAADPVNTPLNLPPGLSLIESDGVIIGTTSSTGEYPNTLIAHDDVIPADTAPTLITFIVTGPTPVSNNDTFSVNEDQTLSINVTNGILKNDQYFDPLIGTITTVNSPSHALSFTLNPDGSFTYTPDANYNGSDSFSYRLVNTYTRSEVATVQIQVSPVNDQPVASSQALTNFQEDVITIIDIAAQDIDNDNLQYNIPQTTVQGAMLENIHSINNGAGRRMTYQLPQDFFGSDSFQFTVDDGRGEPNSVSEPATITMEVSPRNDVPVAVDDNVGMNPGQTSITIDVLANDIDVDGDNLIITVITNPRFNSSFLSIIENGNKVQYQPNSSYLTRLSNGERDSFQYRVSDQQSATTALGNVTVGVYSRTDLNLDDQTNIDDLIEITKSIKERNRIGLHRRNRANINGDVELNVVDLIELIRLIFN